MQKLILIPTILLTGLLAFCFAMPGQAHGLLRAVAPVARVGLPSLFNSASDVVPVISGSSASRTAPGSPLPAGSVASHLSSDGPSNQAVADSPAAQDAHSVATQGQENCGRFGKGFHGGKHLFVCPNRPFPGAVIAHS